MATRLLTSLLIHFGKKAALASLRARADETIE